MNDDRPNGLTAQMQKSTVDWCLSLRPRIAAATPNDELARQAVAAIESEDGYEASARFRLAGRYDGDTEHRIALKAIELFQQSTKERREAGNSLSKDQ